MTQAIQLGDRDRVISAHPTQDGDGVRIKRIAGPHLNTLLDPFLLIDEIRSEDSTDYVGGFPAHPHRGFQTLTYMISGGFKHRDSMGNEGIINSGGLQWMSAASGVIHSEMPLLHKGTEQGMHGYQIWLNLPSGEKMRQPAYRDIQGEEVPEYRLMNGILVRALAGMFEVDGKVMNSALSLPESHALLMDVTVPADTVMRCVFEAASQYQLYVIDGALEDLNAGHLAHFSEASTVRNLTVESGAQGARILVLGGQPIREPIAQYGPFVMNTHAELEQALQDYRDDRFIKDAARI